jgi:hypothetical protein
LARRYEMAGKTIRFSDEEIADALGKSHGIIKYAADLLPCSRQTIYNRINNSDYLRKLYIDINETNKDYVESKLFELIKKGNLKAIIFFLRHRAKDRGYGEINVKYDLSNLTDHQLARLRKGHDFFEVLKDKH